MVEDDISRESDTIGDVMEGQAGAFNMKPLGIRFGDSAIGLREGSPDSGLSINSDFQLTDILGDLQEPEHLAEHDAARRNNFLIADGTRLHAPSLKSNPLEEKSGSFQRNNPGMSELSHLMGEATHPPMHRLPRIKSNGNLQRLFRGLRLSRANSNHAISSASLAASNN
jgi:hypothetical protein